MIKNKDSHKKTAVLKLKIKHSQEYLKTMKD